MYNAFFSLLSVGLNVIDSWCHGYLEYYQTLIFLRLHPFVFCIFLRILQKKLVLKNSTVKLSILVGPDFKPSKI